MRTPVLACVAVLVVCACGQGQGAPDEIVSVLDNAGEPADPPSPALAGQWETVLQTSVEPRPLVLTIDLAGAEPEVILTAPNQGGAQIAFEQVRLDAERIGFATPLGALRFEGALKGEDRIAGQVHQGGYRSELAWTRVADRD